jgi:hypothetical protein
MCACALSAFFAALRGFQKIITKILGGPRQIRRKNFDDEERWEVLSDDSGASERSGYDA